MPSRTDLDLVILPPELAPADLPALDADRAAAAADGAVGFALRSLPGMVPRAAMWWGGRPRRVLAGRAAPDLLDGLATRLLADGWRVRRGRRAYDRLVADRDGVDLVATYVDSGIVTVTVLGPRAAERGER